MEMSLEKESKKATQLLKNKVVGKILRHRKDEVVIQFTDGTNLYIDVQNNQIELSIT